MVSHVITVSRVAVAWLLLPLCSFTAFAPSGAGSAPAAPVVATSVGTVPLPGEEALPSVANSLKPIMMPGVSIKNFGVVDGRIFRGEQPSRSDYADLARIGVKTVVDLRLDAKKDSKATAESAGLQYVNIPIDDHSEPTDEEAVAFLKVVNDPDSGVCYVHCAGGRHRTGSMIAIYRMTHDGWTLDQAYQEMLAYDFYTGGGHGGFKTYVEDYYRRMTLNPSTVPAAYPTVAPPG